MRLVLDFLMYGFVWVQWIQKAQGCLHECETSSLSKNVLLSGHSARLYPRRHRMVFTQKQWGSACLEFNPLDVISVSMQATFSAQFTFAMPVGQTRPNTDTEWVFALS